MHLTYIAGKQTNNVSGTRLVMSTTLIDPTQQGASGAGVSITTELPDPSTYKVYRPPDVSGSEPSKRQYKVLGRGRGFTDGSMKRFLTFQLHISKLLQRT